MQQQALEVHIAGATKRLNSGRMDNKYNPIYPEASAGDTAGADLYLTAKYALANTACI